VRQRVSDLWKEGKTGSPQNIYSYSVETVECSENISSRKTFYAYEWKNTRFGKVIESVSLNASTSYKNYNKKEIQSNAIFLLGLSYVEKRPVPDGSFR